MPDQTDPVRELVHWAYQIDGDSDLTAGLLDVVRRAEPAPMEIQIERAVHGRAPRRQRTWLVSMASFAAAIVVILVGVIVSGHGLRQSGIAAGGSPTVGSDGGNAPSILPTECAGAWTLKLHGTTFAVSGTSGCPPLPSSRLWLLDAASGNGLIMPGNATVWPVTPVGTGTTKVSAPFAFTVAGWPGPAHGHYYEVWYVGPGDGTAHAGDDAMTLYNSAHVLSRLLLYP